MERPEQEWQVWEDWASDDVLAVETDAMTPALAQALKAERMDVRCVQARDRAAAVRAAFPQRFGFGPSGQGGDEADPVQAHARARCH